MLEKLATLLKRNSNRYVFLRILRKFKVQLFYRTPPVAASTLRRSENMRNTTRLPRKR